LYVAYLFLVDAGLGPKIAMSLAYFTGVVLSFTFNRRWSFDHAGPASLAFRRYCSAYAMGYFCNLGGLYLLVDILDFPHRTVQGVLVLLMAAMLFLLQKFWVFRGAAGGLRTS
jgi:putative flippase GtrA